MTENQEKAWDCLTEQEQQLLFLSFSQGLSSREAGSILKISHYKLLEHKARAERLFKLFSDYFELHPDLIRPGAPLASVFKDYLYGSMMKRLSREESLFYAGDSSWLLRPVNRDQIIKYMGKLKKSEDKWDKDLYALIMEFDRWNNYRILPRILQAPTPFKRRSTKKDKVYLSFLHRIPDYKIRAMVDIFWRHGKPEKRYYCSFISTIFPDGYTVVPIVRKKPVIEEITNTKIYIFEDRFDAEEFGLLVSQYFMNTAEISGAMKFWKRYRELIQNAINYKEINNMDFTCENLEMAYKLKRKPLHQRVKENRERQKNIG